MSEENLASVERITVASYHTCVKQPSRTFYYRSATLLGLALVAVFLIWFSCRIGGEIAPFDTDEAEHAGAALRIAAAVSNGGFSDFAAAVRRASFYPPLHALFVAPWYLLWEPSPAASRLPSVLAFALALGVIFAVTRRLLLLQSVSKAAASWAAASAVLFACLSPITLINAGLCMVEPLGFLLMALLLLQFAHEKTLVCPKRTAIAAVTAAAICLTKYSFAVVLLPALACFFLAGMLRRLIPLRQAILFWSVTGLLLLLFFFWCDRESAAFFFVGHRDRGSIFTLQQLSFYPRVFLKRYSIHWFFSISAILLALTGAFRYRRLPAVQFALWTVGLSLVILNMTSVKGARHIMFALPCLWFLTGCGLHVAAEKLPAVRGEICAKVLVLLCPIAFGAALVFRFEELQLRLVKGLEARPEFSAMVDFIFENADPCRPILTIGTADSFSLESLRWEAAKRCPVKAAGISIDSYPFSEAKESYDRLRGRDLSAPWLPGTGVPKRGFKQILKSGYYTALVTVQAPHRPVRKTVAEFVLPLPAKHYAAAGWRVGVYSIGNVSNR